MPLVRYVYNSHQCLRMTTKNCHFKVKINILINRLIYTQGYYHIKNFYIILISLFERYLQKRERDREADEKKLREKEFRSTFNQYMAQKNADKDQKMKEKAMATMKELMNSSKNEHEVNNRKF